MTSAAVPAVGSYPSAEPGSCSKIGLADAVELGLELRRACGRRAERIELHGEMTVALDGAEERGGGGGFAKERRVVAARRGRRRPAELLGHSKELAPGFVDRGGITTIRLVRFRDQPVVEDARDGKARHGSKSNGERRDPASAARDADRLRRDSLTCRRRATRG